LGAAAGAAGFCQRMLLERSIVADAAVRCRECGSRVRAAARPLGQVWRPWRCAAARRDAIRRGTRAATHERLAWAWSRGRGWGHYGGVPLTGCTPTIRTRHTPHDAPYSPSRASTPQTDPCHTTRPDSKYDPMLSNCTADSPCAHHGRHQKLYSPHTARTGATRDDVRAWQRARDWKVPGARPGGARRGQTQKPSGRNGTMHERIAL